MIPMSIGYATEAVLPAPTIRELTPRGLDQHWRGFESLDFLVGFGRIHSDLVPVLDSLGGDSDIQGSTKTKPNITRGVHFKRKHDSIFGKEFSS
jgi:hypothetical protein